MLLLVSPEDSMSFFFFFFCCAEPPLFFSARGLSLVTASRRDFLVTYVQVSHCCSYSCCRAQAQYLCSMGLGAPRHMVSSQTRDQTRVLCIGR